MATTVVSPAVALVGGIVAEGVATVLHPAVSHANNMKANETLFLGVIVITLDIHNKII